MAGSRLEFIPSSKWSWHLEGDEVLRSVTAPPASLWVTVEASIMTNITSQIPNVGNTGTASYISKI